MRNKVENILKFSLKRKIRITQALLTFFLITGTVSYAEENIVNISITNVGEGTGLELGTNSRSRGTGSIATGKNAVSLGVNAVATGNNETKETILRKLQENKQRVDEIANQKKIISAKTNELAAKQARERATIEAGVRVEQVRKAKERAKTDYDNKVREVNELKANSEAFLNDYKAKLNDLNSRLGGLSQIPNVNISSEEGLTNAATELKRIAENGTTLNLTIDFYKDYVSSYYRALGDLRLNEIKYTKMSSISFNSTHNSATISSIVNTYRNLEDFEELDDGYYLFENDFRFTYTNATNLESKAFKDGSNLILKYKNHLVDLTTVEEYNNAKRDAPLFKEKFRTYFNNNNDFLLTQDIKEKMYVMHDLKIDYYLKKYEITYYQKQYEDTKNTQWLDKKRIALQELENIKVEYNSKFYRIDHLKNKEIVKWKKENIDDIKQKNKMTVDRLTSELETALNINKNAILERENQIKALESQRDQAKANYERLNPTQSDLTLAAEYQRVKQEVVNLSNEIVNANERLRALQEALTLNDLTNIGENQIAVGTDSLAVGNNAIAQGKSATTVGENSIAIGNLATTTGQNSITIGTEGVSNGSKLINIGYKNTIKGTGSSVIGDPNLVYGDNNHVLGNNNKIGTDLAPKNNVFILGSNVDASTIENAIVLGNESTAVSNAVSVGSANNLRKITNVAEGELSTTSNDVVTGKQLKNIETTLRNEIANATPNIDLNTLANSFIKTDGTNIDTNVKNTLVGKLSEGSSLTNPTGSLVTDTIVKQGLDTKVDKSDFSNTNITSKVTKGELTSTDFDIQGTGKLVESGLTINLSSTLRNKINEIDNKLDKTTYENDKQTNTTNLNNKANINGDNINKTEFTTNLTNGANLTTPTGTVVTDTIVKQGLDTKLDKTTYENDKQTNATNLNNKVNITGDNINKTEFTNNLTNGANLSAPTGTVVTDTIVKQGLDTKVDKSSFTGEAISNVLTKGNVNSTTLDIVGNGKLLDSDLTLNIKNGAINESHLSNELKNSLSSNYVKTDGSNVTGDVKNTLVNKLSEGSNLTNPTNSLVTDTIVKQGLDTKVDKSSFTSEGISNLLTKGNVNSTTLDITGNGKLLDSDLTLNIKNGAINESHLSNELKNSLSNNYIKTDGSNITNDVKTTLVNKLSEGSDLNNPTNSLITDTKVKQGLDTKLDKTTYETDKQNNTNVLNSKVNVDGDNINKTEFTNNLTNGADLSNPTGTIVTDTIVKQGLDTKLDKTTYETDKQNNTNVLNSKANVDGSNIISSKDKENFRTNIEVYSKNEIENKLQNLTARTVNLDGEITVAEDKGVKGKVIHRHLVENYVNKADMQMRDEMIINNYNEIQKNKIAIAENTRKIGQAEKKINKTAALSTAMAGMEYPSIGVGEVSVGAGISGFGGEQGVAVGVSYMPTENLLFGLKYAALIDNRFNGAVSSSIGYKFRLHN